MMGYPIIHNRAMVWKVDPDTGRLQVVARRLTNVMGLTFGADGSLYVLENSTRFGFPRAGTGKIVKVSGHKRTTIARGLDLPMGITMGPDHALYVADRGFGFAPGQGRILRIELPS
jgi:glucose/arabinose dehydrogenase